jgi:hypothetical protein
MNLQSSLLSIYLFIYTLVDFGRFFAFLIRYTVRRTTWMGDQPVAKPLPTHRTTQTQNKCTQTSMPLIGFEPTIPVLERAVTACTLDRAADQRFSVSLTNELIKIRDNLLYKPSDRRFSAKLVPTFADRGCRVVNATDPHCRILGFRLRTKATELS